MIVTQRIVTQGILCAACGKVIGGNDLYYIISKADWAKHKAQFTSTHPYYFVVNERIS